MRVGNSIDHEVGPEALHRHRRMTGRHEAPVQFGQRRGRDDQEREAIGEGGARLDRAGPAPLGQAHGVRVEARQPQRPTQEIAEPLRRQVAHVERRERVVPDTHAAIAFHRVEPQVQGEHARRAQHQLVGPLRGPHERHPRQLPLADEVAVGADHHPLAVVFESGVDEQRFVDGHAAARLDRVQMDFGEAQHVRGGAHAPIICREARAACPSAWIRPLRQRRRTTERSTRSHRMARSSAPAP